MNKLGFIGCGKMASAIIKGVLKSSNSGDFMLRGSEVNDEVAKSASERLGIEVISDNKKLAEWADVILIATKPNMVVEVLNEIKPVFASEKLLISIAAGVSTPKINNVLPTQRVVRVMPNTPALLGFGMAGITGGKNATKDDLKFVHNLMNSVGEVIEVEESQMDIVTAISGSGPAFFYQVIEDMARAGEKLGLDYEKSLLLATQTARGSAEMVMKRGETSVQTLIDNVATKGGCTFVGITAMKEENSDKLFDKVIKDTAKKASELG
ncbi:pyrroline-5-carboxylate reductase [bacterium]|nr:pyrroline-5-carboxylate reductase [bacterium]